MQCILQFATNKIQKSTTGLTNSLRLRAYSRSLQKKTLRRNFLTNATDRVN